GDRLARLGRPEQRARASQRHVLPGPGFLALVAFEAVEADRERPLRAERPEARVDLVERAFGGRHAERGGDPLGKAVEVQRSAERAAAVGLDADLAGEQVDEVEVGGLGQLATAEAAEPE